MPRTLFLDRDRVRIQAILSIILAVNIFKLNDVLKILNSLISEVLVLRIDFD